MTNLLLYMAPLPQTASSATCRLDLGKGRLLARAAARGGLSYRVTGGEPVWAFSWSTVTLLLLLPSAHYLRGESLGPPGRHVE
jgi:hypothetical protein